mmetsp:Transcript_1112/g.3290  ORF Transcript_1112/g.3290 Transcript_1112/m.3290 type:complete len:208 (-) Transcript_1112:895-1518(-)
MVLCKIVLMRFGAYVNVTFLVCLSKHDDATLYIFCPGINFPTSMKPFSPCASSASNAHHAALWVQNGCDSAAKKSVLVPSSNSKPTRACGDGGHVARSLLTQPRAPCSVTIRSPCPTDSMGLSTGLSPTRHRILVPGTKQPPPPPPWGRVSLSVFVLCQELPMWQCCRGPPDLLLLTSQVFTAAPYSYTMSRVSRPHTMSPVPGAKV